jgi:hypothetical protein
MKAEDFKKGKKVIHTLREEWGEATVTYIYEDGSVLVRFPNGPSKHKNNTNTFRYYKDGLKYFESVS